MWLGTSVSRADCDIDRQVKLDQASLQQRHGQVIAQFDPCVRIARRSSELLEDKLAGPPKRRTSVAEIEVLEQVVRPRLGSGEVVLAVLPPESIQADVEFVQRQIMLPANVLDFVRSLEAMSERTQMLTPGRRRRRERLIRPERHAPAFLSQNARGGQPIRGRERSSRSIYRQGRSAPFTGINNSRDHTIGRRLRGSRCLAPSGWAVTFKPIGPVGRKRLAVVEAE